MKKIVCVFMLCFGTLLVFAACSNNNTIPSDVMTPERERTTALIQEVLQVTEEQALIISRTFQLISIPEIVRVENMHQTEYFQFFDFWDVNGDVYRTGFDVNNIYIGITRIDKRGEDGEFEIFWTRSSGRIDMLN